jgi:transcriptional regulator with XRE-family HTH domain
MTIFQGQKLRDLRSGAGLTQKQLADAAKVRRESISHAESGAHKPTAEALARIAKALDVPLDSFFEDESEAVA